MEDKPLLPRAEKLNEKELETYFSSLGYEIQTSVQPWRHLVLTGNKNGQKCIVKIASTVELSNSLKNEYAWYQLFKIEDARFYIPKVLESGHYNDLFWFSVEYIEGQILADKKPGSKTDLLEANLPALAEFLGKSSSNTLSLLPKDIHLILNSRHKNILAEVERRLVSTDVKPATILEILNNNIESLEVDSNHGDFVPWHIIQSANNTLCIIDPEHASFLGLKMYDAAYFYHRIYGTLQRSDLAKRFLQLLNNYLNEQGRKQFEYILAFRIAGGYWEALDQKWIPREPQDQLLDKLIQKSLWD